MGKERPLVNSLATLYWPPMTLTELLLRLASALITEPMKLPSYATGRITQ